MSEDSLQVEFFSIDIVGNKQRKNEFERIYRQYVPEEETSKRESSIEYHDTKASYFAGFFDADRKTIDHLIQELDQAGAKNIVVSVWYDSVGEEAFFIRMNNDLLQFDSKEEIKDYLKDLSDKSKSVAINYHKEGIDKTILLRLHISAKSKRRRISELFTRCLAIEAAGQRKDFVDTFNQLVRSQTHDIAWCKFKWSDEQQWREVASSDLIDGLVDVVEHGEYLYLGFDTAKLEQDGHFELDDFVWFVFFHIDGVKKVWVKFRPGGSECAREQYLYYPGMGDESWFIEVNDLSDDNHWPKY